MHNFRKVLLVSISFLLLVGLMSLAIVETYIHSEYAFDEDVKLRRSLAGEIDYLFLGASHIQQAVIPAQVDQGLGVNSYILADGWQSIPLSRTFLETELARNPVKEVVLDVTYDTMVRTKETDSVECELYALPRLENASQRIAYIRETFKPSRYRRVFISYMQYGSEYLINKALGKNVKNVIDENKGFKDMPARNVRIADKNIEESYNEKAIDNEWMAQNTEGLAEIIRLCKDRDIKVTIVVMPISQAKIWNYDGWDVFLGQLRDYCAQNRVKMVDFNLLKERTDLFSDETSFSNREHLCTEGAKAFTPVYVRVMKDISEGKNISSQFYTNYAELKQHCQYAEIISKE